MGEIINVDDYMKNKGIDILNSIHVNGFKTEYEKQCEEDGFSKSKPDYTDPLIKMDYAYFVARVINTDSAKLLYEIVNDENIKFDIDKNFKELVVLLNDNIVTYSTILPNKNYDVDDISKNIQQIGIVIGNTAKIVNLDCIVLNKLYQDGIDLTAAHDLLLDIKEFNDVMEMI